MRSVGSSKHVALLLLLCFVGSLAAARGAAAAAPLKKSVESLAIVPDDAAFYVAMLRNREQIEAIGKSKAWAELKSIPSLQMGWMLVNMQLSDPESPLAQAQQFFAVPENKQLLNLLRDMVSDEVFYYGGSDYNKLLDLIGAVNRANQMASVTQALDQEGDGNASARAMVDTLVENPELLVIPETVFGFRLQSNDVAKAQLARLEGVVKAVLGRQAPQYASRFERRKIGGGEYLVISLDGSLVPWHELEAEEAGVDPKKLDKLKAILREKTLEIHLGLYKNFVMISTGPNGKHLESLGEGDLLANREEFKRLEPLADKRLFSISYLSETLANGLQGGQQDIETIRSLAEMALPAAELEEELESRIRGDINDLIDEAKEGTGSSGAILGASFGTERGVESYAFNWAENSLLDSSKQLTLLQHLGGSPLLAVVGRSKYDPESYELLRTFLRKAFGYFEEIALPKMSDDEKEQYVQGKEKLLPLVKRLDRTTQQALIPSLADSQMALVIDAQMKSKQWLVALPATAKPLPMLEPAVMLGVSDSDLLVKAMKQYRNIINEAIVAISELSGEENDFQIPVPKVQQVEEGKIYAYPLPMEAGLDKRIVPNAGLNDAVAVLTASRQHTRRLLAETPLPSDGLLEHADRPLATFARVDLAGFAEAVHPWIEFAVRVNMAPGGDEDEGSGLGDPANDNENVTQILDQVRSAFNVLKCLRSYTSLTYEDDGVWVTRGELQVVDLVE